MDHQALLHGGGGRWLVAGGCLVLDETGRCRFDFRRWWWHAPMHARGSKQLAEEYLLGPS